MGQPDRLLHSFLKRSLHGYRLGIMILPVTLERVQRNKPILNVFSDRQSENFCSVKRQRSPAVGERRTRRTYCIGLRSCSAFVLIRFRGISGKTRLFPDTGQQISRLQMSGKFIIPVCDSEKACIIEALPFHFSVCFFCRTCTGGDGS